MSGGMEAEDQGATLTINGGNLYVNANGDGLDANGDILITGGNLTLHGPDMEAMERWIMHPSVRLPEEPLQQ